MFELLYLVLNIFTDFVSIDVSTLCPSKDFVSIMSQQRFQSLYLLQIIRAVTRLSGYFISMDVSAFDVVHSFLQRLFQLLGFVQNS